MSSTKMHPPKVAVVLTQLGYGGAERQTVELLRRLSDSPWRPALVVCLSGQLAPFGPQLQQLGYRVVSLPRLRSFDPGRLRRLRRLIINEEIDLVHAVHLLASGYTALATSFGRRAAMLPTVRGAREVRGLLRRLVYRRMILRCPVTLVNSEEGRRVMVDHLRVPPEKLRVVSNGLDFALLDRHAADGCVRAELGMPPDAPIVLYVGKHAPVKDIPLLAGTLEKLLRRRSDAHALIVGHGLGPQAREAVGPALPRDRTHWLGPRDDVPRIMSESDALILTSRSEGCPNVVLEALALGLPVVSSQVGDIASIVGAELSDLIVSGRDADAYASTIERVLGDPERYSSLARARRPELERRFGMSAMVSETIALWQSLSEARTPQRGW